MVAIASFWDERKLLVFVTLIILACAAMLLELAAVRRGDRSLIDQFVPAIVTPVQRAVSLTFNSLVGEIQTLGQAGTLGRENASLREKVQRLASANERLKDEGRQNLELQRLLRLAQTKSTLATAADVVGYTPESARRQITIDRGWRDGVRRDAVVMDDRGLVGHVIDAGGHDAHVLLITDPTSSVPAYLRSTRSWGIVTGTWRRVRMKYIGQDVKIRPGDTVVTGRGEVYPGGVPIGTIREVDRKDNALYQTAVIDPAVDFNSLRRVLVLKPQ